MADAGWYPVEGGALRWWDGACWTEHVHVPDNRPPVIFGPPAGEVPEPFDRAGASAREKADELMREASDWQLGARGEETVATELALLADPWHVVHDIPIGQNGANLDHVVIGVPGVFVLNTKTLTGKVKGYKSSVWHEKSKRWYVQELTREIERAKTCIDRSVGLDVPAFGGLVFLCDELVVKEEPDGIRFTDLAGLLPWLRSEPMRLTADSVGAIAGAAHYRSTWRGFLKAR